jgi:hypothetical protein
MAEKLAETAKLEKRLEESLVRITELKAQLSSRPGEEGGGDVESAREGERQGGNREANRALTTTQQTPISVDSKSEKKYGDVAGRALDAMFAREDSEATIDSTHADNANKSAAPQSPTPTADISLLNVMSEHQLDSSTDKATTSEVQESRESVLANMTIIDVYNVLRARYGPGACIEITTVLDSGPTTTDGVEEGNVGAEGGMGGMIIDGYPIIGIPGFLKTTPKNILEPTPIQDTTLADLQNEHAQLQQRYDGLQIRYDAAIASEEAIRQDNSDNHCHYLNLLGAAKRRHDKLQQEGKAPRREITAPLLEDSYTIKSDFVLSILVPRHDGPLGELLGSPDREAEDLGRKHLFHHGRIAKASLQNLLAEFEQIGYPQGLPRLIPSRRDQSIFPKTWAWLDQELGRLFSDGHDMNSVALKLRVLLMATTHGQWPEVKLMTYSWAFYKVLDSVWEDIPESKFIKGDASLQPALHCFMLHLSVQIPWTIQRMCYLSNLYSR